MDRTIRLNLSVQVLLLRSLQRLIASLVAASSRQRQVFLRGVRLESVATILVNPETQFRTLLRYLP